MNARRVARPDSVGVIAVLAMTHMLCLRPQPRPYSMSFCRPSHSASARSRASGREPVACTRVSSQQAGRPRVQARTGRRSLGSARVRAAARGLWAGPGRARTGSSARTLSRRCHRVREPGRGTEPTQPKNMRLRASAGRRPRPRCAANARPPPPRHRRCSPAPSHGHALRLTHGARRAEVAVCPAAASGSCSQTAP